MATKLVQGPHSLRNRLLIAAGALAALVAGVLAAERPGSADAAASTGYSVVIISGDGMGPAQRTATQLAKYGYKTQPMDALPEGGLLKTNSILPVTDSAAGATAMGTGHKVNNNQAGLAPNGKKLYNLVEEARDLGKSTGLVEDHDVTNATMMGFAAHVKNRDNKAQAARQYLSDTHPDVIFGGGEEVWYPEGHPGKLPDVISDDESTGRENLVEKAIDQGYQYAWNRKTFDQLSGPQALALVQDDAYIRGHEIKGYRKDKDPYFVPEPVLMEKALEILGQNPEGFFIAADVDELDDAGHEHDGKSVIQSGQIVNKMVEVVQEYRETTDPNVLLIVTADHETGGMTVEMPASKSTNSGPDGDVPSYGTPQNVPLPGGKTPKRSGPFKVKGKDAKFKVDWTTPGHTGLMVPVTADGPGAERFSGVHPNTFVHEVASDVLNGNP